MSADDEKMWHPPPPPDLSDEIKGVGRRLDLHAEHTKTQLELLTEKAVTGLTNILEHIEDFVIRLDRAERARIEDRKLIDEHERRLAALESKGAKPRKK